MVDDPQDLDEAEGGRTGHARLLQLADAQAPGRRVWALEGTGCYGAGLTRFLVDQGEWVVEIDRPKRPRAATAPRATPWTPSMLAGAAPVPASSGQVSAIAAPGAGTGS